MKLEKKIFFNIYLFSNIIAVSLYLIGGTIGGDLRGYPIDAPFFLIVSLMVTLGFMYITCVILFSFIDKTIKVKPILVTENYFLFDVIILIINISYGFFTLRYNVGMAGVAVSGDIPSVPMYLFILLQPTYLVYIYLAFTGGHFRKLLILNALVLLVFAILKGWLSSVLYIVFILLMFNREYVVREKKKFIYLSVFALVFSPILRFMKSVVAAVNTSKAGISYDQAISAVLEYREINSVSEFLSRYFLGIVERFEHAGILYYVLVDDKVKNILSSYSITPFFAEGWLQNRLYRLLVSDYETIDLQFLLADFILPLFRWRVNTTLPVWISLSPVNAIYVCIYAVVLMLCCIILSKLISQNVVNFSWLAVLVMLHHGWFYSFSLYLQALFVFVCFMLVFRIGKLL